MKKLSLAALAVFVAIVAIGCAEENTTDATNAEMDRMNKELEGVKPPKGEIKL